MERDKTSQRQGYTAKSYIATLEEGLKAVYEPPLRFQQDNASIHKAGITKTWFEENAISLLDWPPHSPDLNPIEHI